MLRRGSIRGSISRSIMALLLTSKLVYRVSACVGVLPVACCLLPAACCLLSAAGSRLPPPAYPHATSAPISACHDLGEFILMSPCG
jgi:hypothetical protein